MTPAKQSVILSAVRRLCRTQSKNPDAARPTSTARTFLPAKPPFASLAALPSRPLRLFLCLFSLSLIPASAQPPTSPTKGKVSGAATYALTKQFLAAAPKRFVGSPGHAAAEAFIKSHFAPEIADHRFDLDSFTANTPVGLQTVHNYIVRFPGKKDGIIVLATHYETNYPLKDVDFVGANDGACTTALLIEIGEYLRKNPPQGYSVWLLFDDAEEAVANPPYNPSQWGDGSSALYGTRHLAAKWSQDGVLPKIKAFLLADMIGDKNLDIDHDASSDNNLWLLLVQAAKNTGHTAALSKDNTPVDDDTVPFHKRGVPVLDIIDYNYGPHDAKHPDGYHHTPEDTLDKLSPQSLQTAADLFLEMITLINQH